MNAVLHSSSAVAPPVVISTRVAGQPTPRFFDDLTQKVAANRVSGVTLAIDIREIDSREATADIVRDLAARLGDLVVHGLRRVAIVAGDRKVSIGISRMLQAYAEASGVKAWCFTNQADAKYWLTSHNAD